MTKILFVCHGSICRSPMAEFIFGDLVKKANLEDVFLELTADPAEKAAEEGGEQSA